MFHTIKRKHKWFKKHGIVSITGRRVSFLAPIVQSSSNPLSFCLSILVGLSIEGHILCIINDSCAYSKQLKCLNRFKFFMLNFLRNISSYLN